MPQYKKVFDIGTYTGNGGQYRVGIPTLRGVGPSGGQVAGSLRFRASNSNLLTKTFGSAGNRQKMTFSFWLKKSIIAGGAVYGSDWSGSGLSQGGAFIKFSSGQLYVTNETNNSSDWVLTTKVAVFNDTSKWYHIVVAFDTTQATAANRVRIYIDNLEVTSFTTNTPPSQNYSTKFNGTALRIGSQDGGGSPYDHYDGYLADFNFVDGTQLTPSSFGEYNSDGIWVPKPVTGLTYGSNGYYLKFASGAVGTDSSGNGNTWTLNNFNVTTANTTYDIMTDSPTDYLSGSMTTANNAGNYATLNPIDSQCTLSNGNLRATGSTNSSYYFSRSTQSIPTTGSWYWEVTATTLGTYLDAGVMGTNRAFNSTYYVGYYSNELGFFNGSGTNETYQNGVNILSHSALNAGDVIMFAHSEGKTWIGVNGTWLNSGNPSAGTGYIGNILSESLSPAVSLRGASAPVVDMNFGQRAFAYTVPSGFKALNTYNYPRPADSSLWFYGDTPDLMWIKNRSTTGLHTITDTVRGMGLNLVTSSTAAETSYPGVTEMNKFGMTVINDATSIVNGSGNSMVYWGWKAGSNTSSTSVTNNDGTITSQVSANRQAGFSIVNWTGTGATGTLGHGLGVVPNMIIVKSRSGSDAWYVYHSSRGSTKRVQLNESSAETSGTTVWNSTEPTSSVFSIGNGNPNSSSVTYMAYCWTAIPGYSAFGSYTGNGSADGPFIYCGFLPRFIMTKGSSGITDWVIHDVTRETYNPASSSLYPNTTGAEAALEPFDILSNGFKIRGTAGNVNNNGTTYIYAAFASIPFKFSRAR